MAADDDRKRAAGRLASFVLIVEGCQAWRRWDKKESSQRWLLTRIEGGRDDIAPNGAGKGGLVI